MRIFLEKFLIIIFCLYNSHNINLTTDIVFLFLSSIIISLLLDLSRKKQHRLVIYFSFILMCFLNQQYVLYIPLIIYNMYLDLRGYTAITLILLFLDFSPFNLMIALLSIYLSARTDDYNKLLDSTKLTHNSLIEDTFHLRNHNEQLEKDKEKNIHIAILTERNRISRELHDSIGHIISSSILQVEALKVISENENIEPLNMLQNTLDKGMEDIRNSIHNLYSESLDLKAKIYELSEDFPKLKIELNYKITSDLSYDLKFDILSIIRETITNCAKHSNASKLVLNLLEQPKFYSLIIKDNGNHLDADKNLLNKGMGMSSMKQIADKYGGSFNYEYDHGFKIHTTLMKG